MYFFFFFFFLLFYLFRWGIFQVDSANKRGSLLEVVQILTDMNLIIKRAYISSDGEWFMDGKLLMIYCFSNYIKWEFWLYVLNFYLFYCSVSCNGSIRKQAFWRQCRRSHSAGRPANRTSPNLARGVVV